MSGPQASTRQRFFGKFRGRVTMNDDPLQLGRVQAEVPQFPEIVTNWAMPCVPYAGPGVGFHFIPPVGANVWIEFEGGEPNYPIWVGCFWSDNQVPVELLDGGTNIKLIKTESNTLVLDDTPEFGGIRASSKDPAVDEPSSVTITPN